ncbi:helix-turn-helix domain-containing protein [Alkalibacterium thalassium]|uniref:Transcriptional regulator, contains XRE-family HTH domain n=1 Tax=Alkalibacterium thalassium TaxID=426701 RepID=A0A1G8VT51_9LACT|nr:helix-turn-helix transcriptional regulator [Alkalibacterium thalassium]SDJ69224.1 Transcriptional regulator, contains XRE-family HTH domain [Alkalibacterium thalassium]
MNIGHRLANLREKKGLSQAALAERLGMSQSSIAMWETNKRRVPDDALIKLADYYNVSTDYLLGRDVPEWASTEDVFELQTLLENNVNMAYGGESLTEEEKQRVKDILTTLFWDKLQKKKEGGKRE